MNERGGLDERVHLRHRIGKQHVRLLPHGHEDIVQRTDRADIISIRMFVTDQQEALVGFQKIHGLLLADLFGVVHCKAHSFTSSL